MDFSLFFLLPYATLFLFLLISYTLYKHYSQASVPNLPPGKLGLPLIGESLEFLAQGWKGRPEKFFYDRIARFSPRAFKTSLLGEPTIYLCGASGNKFLFTNETTLVTPWWPSSMRKVLPTPLSEELLKEETMKLRKIVQNVFKPESHNKFASIMDSIAQRHFAMSWENEKEVVVYPLAKRFTFWLACHLFMSVSEPEEVEKLADPFNVLTAGMISVPVNLPGTPMNRGIKGARTIKKQLVDIMKQRKIDLAEKRASPTQDILSHMLLFTDEKGQHMSEKAIPSEIIALLMAGHDTASSAITGVVKYLAELPQVYDEVYKEHMEILKSKAPGDLLNWEDLLKMKYSWNVAREVMRVAPPVTGFFREALQDFNYDGYSVPKGWKLYWSANTTHKNPEYYPEPEKFDPSRFNGSGPAPYTFIPFGGGPRMCPGKEYARLEILVFIHNIIKRFKWEKIIPNEEIIFNPGPMPTNGLPIRLYRH